MRILFLALAMSMLVGLPAAGAAEHPGLELELRPTDGALVAMRIGGMTGAVGEGLKKPVIAVVTVSHVVKSNTHCFVAEQWLPTIGSVAPYACRHAAGNANLVLYFSKDAEDEGRLTRVELNDRDDTSPWGFDPVRTTYVFVTRGSHRCWYVWQGGQWVLVCPPPIDGEH